MPLQRANKGAGLSFALTLLIFVGALFYSLSQGASDIPWTALFTAEPSETWQLIFWEIRLPRVLVAAFAGGALAAAGVISQGVFRNPLAGPSVLGTTGGANLFVVFLIYAGSSDWHWLVQPLAAFAGALLSSLLVLRLAALRLFRGNEGLLLLGFSLNSIFAALTSFILALSLPRYGTSQAISSWLLGSISGKGWLHVEMMLPGIFLGLAIARWLGPRLDVLNLGEELASSLSLAVPRLRQWSIVCFSLLVASAVAVCGGLSFIGLLVPHLTRIYVGPSHGRLLVFSLFNGMSLLMVADTLARTIWAPEELQVGVLIALIGAPLFIVLLIASRRRELGASADV